MSDGQSTNDRHEVGPLAGMKVLVAEDSWHLADALCMTVEAAGGEVVGPVATLAEAERLAASATFSAAIMDLNLHEEMAYGLVERLGARGIKVVVISGYDVAPEIAVKIHATLAKPASARALIAALSRPLAD